MWKYKYFKTYKSMENFIEKNKNRIQYCEVFINNGYCIEYRKLLRIY
jgi:hypothetical protein